MITYHYSELSPDCEPLALYWVAKENFHGRRDSDLKKREMYGPSVIVVRADSGKSEGNGADRTGVRIPQPAGGVSQSSVGGEESASLNRMLTSSMSEAAQQDLSGTMELEDDSNAKRVSFLNAEAKELAEDGNSEPPLPEPSSNTRYLHAFMFKCTLSLCFNILTFMHASDEQ